MNSVTKIEEGDPLALLRQKFPAHQISKLPKETKKQREERETNKSMMVWKCEVCGGAHHKNATHLDYVGHAALTDRLLDTDPMWSWEPVALRDGLPAFDASGGLWIKLTVCGVTRLGYGHAAAKPNMDPGAREKEAIGDALRNAAMRFGAALDLWHKGDLHADEDADEIKPDPIPHADEKPPQKREQLGGPHKSPSALKGALRAFVHDLNGMSERGELEGWLATEEIKALLDQCERDAPAWWNTGEGMPAEFVPLEILIAQKRRDLEQIETLNVRNPITAG